MNPSLINDGVKQWIFQRITNALIVTFGLVLVLVLLSGRASTYDSLAELVRTSGLVYYLAIVLVFSCVNSVLAGWQIEGDYSRKFGIPQKLLTAGCVVVSLIYLVYGLKILFIQDFVRVSL